MFLCGGRWAGGASRLRLKGTTSPDDLFCKQRSNYIPNDHRHFSLGGRGVPPPLIWDIKVSAAPKANWVWILEGATIFFYFSVRSAVWSIWIRRLVAHVIETVFMLQRSRLKYVSQEAWRAPAAKFPQSFPWWPRSQRISHQHTSDNFLA